MVMDKNKIQKLKKFIKPLGAFLSAASVVFIVISIYRLGFDFGDKGYTPAFIFIAVFGVLLKCISLILSADGWADLLKILAEGKDFDRNSARTIYIKSNIGKYLPGNVMHYVERNLFASGLGISQKRIAAGSAGEILIQIVAAFSMAVIMAGGLLSEAVSGVFGGRRRVFFLACICAVTIFCAAAFFARRRIKRLVSAAGGRGFFVLLLKALFKYALSLWLLGFVMVALYAYMGGSLSLKNINIIFSGYIIAWVLGFVTPGASGGIGVRELVIYILMKPLCGESLVITLGVIHRLITVVGDFLMYFAAVLKEKIKRKGERKK